MFRTSDPIEYQILKDNAQRLRRYPTPAESALWQSIRSNQLGVSFRRQHIVGIYIVDFICLTHKLVIELDGKYHDAPEQQEEDMIRTRNLEAYGLRVIRFTNEQVLFELDKTLESIKKELK